MTTVSRRSLPGVLALAIALSFTPRAGFASVVPTGFSDQLVLSGLDAPTGFTFLPDGQRILIVEQNSALLRLLNLNGPLTTLIQVPGVSTTGEEGLLGVAVDPGWPNRAYVYVQYTTDTGIHISRYTVTGDLSYTTNGALAINGSTKYELLVDAPNNAGNHNGGTLRFGKDGMLYSSLGEDAVRCAAQDSVSLRGVILRLDVTRLPSGGGGPPAKSLITPLSGNPFSFHPNPNARLVWLLGLRNPFRFQVDQPTGDLYITDVGENTWEEIDRAPVGGMNFGWPDFEGPAPLSNSCTDANSNFTAPIGYYNRSGFTASIIGAGVYHRAATGADRFPPLYEGNYFYNDYFDGFLRRMKGSGNSWSAAPSVPGQPNGTDWGLGFEHVSDWATGPTGALWYVKQSDENYSEDTGEIHKIVFPQPLSAPDEAPALLLPLIASPAVETARFPFALASPGRVTMRLYDLTGRQVRTLIDGEMREAGPQTPVFWDGRDASGRLAGAGIYLVRLTVDDAHAERRFALIR